MNDLFRRSWHGCFILSPLLASVPPVWAQANPSSPSQTVFVFVQKTTAAARLTSRQLFEQVVHDLDEFLKANDITYVVRTDDLPSGVELPFEAVQEMARNSKAAYLLYVVVDRPTMKWLKLTAACFDASGRQLWSEESSTWKEVIRHHGEQNALKRFHQKLDRQHCSMGIRLFFIRELNSRPSPGRRASNWTGESDHLLSRFWTGIFGRYLVRSNEDRTPEERRQT